MGLLSTLPKHPWKGLRFENDDRVPLSYMVSVSVDAEQAALVEIAVDTVEFFDSSVHHDFARAIWRDRFLSPAAKQTWQALAQAGKSRVWSFISISREIGRDRRTAIRAIKELRERALLLTRRVVEGKRICGNFYIPVYRSNLEESPIVLDAGEVSKILWPESIRAFEHPSGGYRFDDSAFRALWDRRPSRRSIRCAGFIVPEARERNERRSR